VRIVVLGAGGGTGTHVVRLAAEQGHEVVAVARSPLVLPAGARQVTGDATDPRVLAEAVAGAGGADDVMAVVSCLGVTKRSSGHPSALAASALVDLLPAGARTVSVAGAGIDAPGDRKGLGARLVSTLTRRLAGELVADKQEEHDLLAASDLAWTVVRPPRLVHGEPTGAARLTDDAPGLTAKPLPRADLAAVMVQLAVDGGHERRAPFVVR
jgi:putative NADH-flavin reductase